MQLDEKQKGDIAIKILIDRIADDGIPSKQELKRDLPNLAKRIKVPEDQLLAFMHEILPRVVGVRLGCTGVGLEWTNTSEE